MVTARRVVITVVLAMAVAALAVAISVGGDGGRERVQAFNDAVESQTPASNSPGVLKQQQVEIDLATGYTATLSIQGIPIPDDQLNCLGEDCARPLCGPSDAPQAGGSACRVFDDPQNRVYFSPGPEKTFEELPTGTVCAQALVRRVTDEPTEAQPVDWCFRVTA